MVSVSLSSPPTVYLLSSVYTDGISKGQAWDIAVRKAEIFVSDLTLSRAEMVLVALARAKAAV